MSNLNQNSSSKRQPQLSWNERNQAWMAWVRMPDGSMRVIKRKDEADGKRDLAQALAERAGQADPKPRGHLWTFDEVWDFWEAAGYPAPADEVQHLRTLDPNTIKVIITAKNRILAHTKEERAIELKKPNAKTKRKQTVKASLHGLTVERTQAERIEQVFKVMDDQGLATDTIKKTWRFLHHATAYAIRKNKISSAAVRQVYLPATRAAGTRKSFLRDDVRRIIFEALPQDAHPVMWLVGLVCGLRPGEIAGLRWCYIDLDVDVPVLHVMERAKEDDQKYVGQAPPKKNSYRHINLPPLVVAALIKHRDEQQMLNRYRFSDVPFDAAGFVFPSTVFKPHSLKTIRGWFKTFCSNAHLGTDWTTYELRHSFVSLARDELRDLMAVAEVTGHKDIKTTADYAHAVRPATSVAIRAWEGILAGSEEGTVTQMRSA